MEHRYRVVRYNLALVAMAEPKLEEDGGKFGADKSFDSIEEAERFAESQCDKWDVVEVLQEGAERVVVSFTDGHRDFEPQRRKQNNDTDKEQSR